MRPQRWQPTRLPCPWDSPAKNTGVGCHFLFDHFLYALIHGTNILGSYVIRCLCHWALLPSPVTSTLGCHFYFGSVSSFFLELFLHSSSVAYWGPTDLGSSSFSVLSFCIFILFMGFSEQGYWSGLPFPSQLDHVLSELSTVNMCFWWYYTPWLIVSLS